MRVSKRCKPSTDPAPRPQTALNVLANPELKAYHSTYMFLTVVAVLGGICGMAFHFQRARKVTSESRRSSISVDGLEEEFLVKTKSKKIRNETTSKRPSVVAPITEGLDGAPPRRKYRRQSRVENALFEQELTSILLKSEMTHLGRDILGIKVTLCVALTEDVPMLCINSFVTFYEQVYDPALLASLLCSSVMLGMKLYQLRSE